MIIEELVNKKIEFLKINDFGYGKKWVYKFWEKILWVYEGMEKKVVDELSKIFLMNYIEVENKM